MKKVLVVLTMSGLVAGCAALRGGDQGEENSGGSGIERGTTGVSTGADAGMGNGVTGSDSVPPP
jgi:hypothetical protein